MAHTFSFSASSSGGAIAHALDAQLPEAGAMAAGAAVPDLMRGSGRLDMDFVATRVVKMGVARPQPSHPGAGASGCSGGVRGHVIGAIITGGFMMVAARMMIDSLPQHGAKFTCRPPGLRMYKVKGSGKQAEEKAAQVGRYGVEFTLRPLGFKLYNKGESRSGQASGEN